MALVVPTALLLVFHAVHFWTGATGSSAIDNFIGRALAVTCVFGICIGPVIWAVAAIWGLIGRRCRAIFGVTVSGAEMDCASAGASDAQGVEVVTQVGPAWQKCCDNKPVSAAVDCMMFVKSLFSSDL